MNGVVVRFLIWLPDRIFVAMVDILIKATRLFYQAAEGGVARHKPTDSLSKKHLMALYEVYANNRAVRHK